MRALVIVLLVLAAAACGGSDDTGSERTVVAAFYPLAWAVSWVTGGTVEVVNLTPPGAEPHDVELSPGDVETIRDADLVVYVGGGFQPAVEDAVGGGDVPSVDVLAGGSDPHVWLDPVRFEHVAVQLAPALRAERATGTLVLQLRKLDAEYRRGLADCERRTIITTHSAFGQLARRYGLTQLSLAGRSPEAEPSPRELERLVDRVRASGATTVFAEPLVSDEVAQTVAREADVAVATLDPVEGLSRERLEAGEDYLSVMRTNLVALRKALGCR